MCEKNTLRKDEILYITENHQKASEFLEQLIKDIVNIGIKDFSFHRKDLLLSVGKVKVVIMPITGTLLGRSKNLVKWYAIGEFEETRDADYAKYVSDKINYIKMEMPSDARVITERKIIEILEKSYWRENHYV